MEKSNSPKSVAKKKLTLKAELRKIFGRKVKKLRKEGILPANLYGKKIKSQALKTNLKEFLAVYHQAGETGIVELTIEKQKEPYPVLIHNLQLDPVSDQPLHADLYKVDLHQKVQVAIPIELIGEAPGVTKGGVLVPLMDEIEVEALPTDLPDKFEVNISKLEEIGQSISVKDLTVDKTKVKILAEENQLIVNIEAPKEEVEEKPAEQVAAEKAVEGEEAKEEGKEGAKPAEGKPTEEKAPEKKPAEKEAPKPEAKK